LIRKYFKSEKTESWFLLFILSVIWGSSFILIKKGLEVFSPVQVGTIRISFAFLILLPFALRHLKGIPGEKWKIIFFTGMVGNLIPAILFALAETKIESSLTGILNALSPLFTLLIGIYVFHYRISFLQIFGLAIGFIGTLGLGFVNSSGGIGALNLYVWLIVIATFCYGICLNFIKAYLSDMRAMVVTSLAMFSIGPFALIYLFSTDFIFIVNNHSGASEAIAYIAVLGIFGTAIGLVLYTRLIIMTTAFFASIVTYLIPVVAIFWGMVDNESLYPLHFAGMILIMMGIYIINKSEIRN